MMKARIRLWKSDAFYIADKIAMQKLTFVPGDDKMLRNTGKIKRSCAWKSYQIRRKR